MAQQSTDRTDDPVGEEGQADEAPQKLNLQIEVEKPSACERHVIVKIPREDIERYYDKAFSEMMGSAAVPGFRPGRAPRKLIEHRFRKDVADQVKGSLLMDSMAQITDDEKFAAISEPNFDPLVVELPEEGPMTFEFDLEVRPEFDLPEWKGLSVERPMREFSEADVDKRLETIVANRGQLIPFDGAAGPGDYISCNLTFRNGEEVISSSSEEVIRLKPVLSFRDGKIEKFDKQMKGVKAGETRDIEARLTQDAPNEALRGKSVTAVFEVLEVKKLKVPELNAEFLSSLGFDTVEELREMVRKGLDNQLHYQQQQAARKQITAALTASATWDLPPDLLRRQSGRELERAVLELQRNGFSETEIRAHENDLRQNSAAATAKALKEHFILERIAEDQQIDAEPDDYEHEIQQIADQTGESVRRVRARIDKGNLTDALRNQIIERKVIDLVLKHAKFKDVPFKLEGVDTEAVDQAAGGGEEEESIPEATHPGEAEPLTNPRDRT